MMAWSAVIKIIMFIQNLCSPTETINCIGRRIASHTKSVRASAWSRTLGEHMWRPAEPISSCTLKEIKDDQVASPFRTSKHTDYVRHGQVAIQRSPPILTLPRPRSIMIHAEVGERGDHRRSGHGGVIPRCPNSFRPADQPPSL